MNNAVKYGLISGLLLAAYSLVLQLTGSDLRFNTSLGMAIGLIVPLIFMIISVRTTKAEQEGLISFGEAFSASFVTFIISILISTITAYFLIKMWSDADWEHITQMQLDVTEGMMNAIGADEGTIEQATSEITMENMKAQMSGITSQLMGFFVNGIFGAIIAAILSAIMKKNPSA